MPPLRSPLRTGRRGARDPDPAGAPVRPRGPLQHAGGRESRRRPRHGRRFRLPGHHRPPPAAYGWRRPRRRTGRAPDRGPRRPDRRRRCEAARGSPAIRGCDAASSAGWRRSGGSGHRPHPPPATRSRHWPPTSARPTATPRASTARPPRLWSRDCPATADWAGGAAGKCPAPAPAPDWRASWRSPPARRHGDAIPCPHWRSRRGCRGSARHNCGWGRPARRN